MLPDVLTLKEAAAWLRLSERALYDLARARAVPAALLGGKWVFPRARLERWLAAKADEGTPRGIAPPPVIAGSHDPLLDWAVRQSGCGLALRAGGSLEGLEVLAAGQAMAAAAHLRDADSGEWNAPAARDVLGPGGHVGIVWAWRDQGLLVAPGNPRRLGSVADLARPGLTVIGRQNRAGSHVLLVHLLNEAGLRLDAIRFLPDPALAEDEVAAAVADGRAEAGFGIRAEAEARGLGFVPLMRERFDLVMPRRAYFEAPMQALLAFARTTAFAARAARMGGYEVSGTGAVAFTG